MTNDEADPAAGECCNGGGVWSRNVTVRVAGGTGGAARGDAGVRGRPGGVVCLLAADVLAER